MINTTEDFYNKEYTYFYCLNLELIHYHYEFLWHIYLLYYFKGFQDQVLIEDRAIFFNGIEFNQF